MALEEFWRPETSFKTPGMYGEYVRGKESARNQYISEMDKFYAQLDETRKQFAESMGLKREELGIMRFAEEGRLEVARGQLGLAEKTLTSEEKRFSEGLTIEREKLTSAERLQQQQLTETRRMNEQTQGMNEDILNYRKENQDYLRTWFDKLARSAVPGSESAFGSIGSVDPLRAYTTFQPGWDDNYSYDEAKEYDPLIDIDWDEWSDNF